MIVTLTLNPSLDEWVSLERLRFGEPNRALATERYPGGKGINVSRVVHELGGRTLAVALSGGEDGVILGHLLTQRRIPHRFVPVPGRTTRNNYQIQIRSPRALLQINTPGPRVSRAVLRRVERLLRTVRPRPQALVCSGSLPPGAPLDTYRRMLSQRLHAGALTVLDTSGPALRAGLRARPWLIKPNRLEAEGLVGRRLPRRADVAEAIRHLVESGGPRVVVTSLGADGALMASAGDPRVWWAKPPQVPVGSAVGAGDSLVAGFVTGYFKTRSLLEALRLGVACGTASAMTPGTSLCRRQDVRRLSPRIRLTPVR
ncbi:MAG: 1-phosphofructokinase family hexose kinase [Candidatus Omnitrophica bacterium]|nr:1-phosphofructokinase family hexose kinase [Candidatus Omnitrophota bacterium]